MIFPGFSEPELHSKRVLNSMFKVGVRQLLARN